MGTREKFLAILWVACVSALLCGCLGGESNEMQSSSGSASASEVLTYSTDLGDVNIEIPYILEPNKGSSGTVLNLAKPGMIKPLVVILLQDTWGENLETYAASMVGEDETYTEMTTDDGHRMLFYTTDAGRDREGKPIYRYFGFIDYLAEKNVVIEIFGYSKTVLDGDVIAVFDEDVFNNMCRSFAFVS